MQLVLGKEGHVAMVTAEELQGQEYVFELGFHFQVFAVLMVSVNICEPKKSNNRVGFHFQVILVFTVSVSICETNNQTMVFGNCLGVLLY